MEPKPAPVAENLGIRHEATLFKGRFLFHLRYSGFRLSVCVTVRLPSLRDSIPQNAPAIRLGKAGRLFHSQPTDVGYGRLSKPVNGAEA
jgi:hypothetical protein